MSDKLENLHVEFLEALTLLHEAAALFRKYEANHRKKVRRVLENTNPTDALIIEASNKEVLEKATTNEQMAVKLEAFFKRGMVEAIADITSEVPDERFIRARQLLLEQLPSLNAAANPTKSEVHTLCGRKAREVHNAIETVCHTPAVAFVSDKQIGELADTVQYEAQFGGADSPVDRGDAEQIVRAILDKVADIQFDPKKFIGV